MDRMYKRALSCLLMINLLFLTGFLSLEQLEEIQERLTAPVETIAVEERILADSESRIMGIASRTSSGQRVVDGRQLECPERYSLSENELEILFRIVEAEAGCEDEDGRVLVANVILNRLTDEQFPDSIREIVFQREKGVTQFSPVADGSFDAVTVSDTTRAAVRRALEGEDLSQGALYFASRKYADSERMRWFDEKLHFLFSYGGHEFFTE